MGLGKAKGPQLCFTLGQVVSAEEQDTGRYTCRAQNPAGASEKHFNLNVWGEGSGGGSLPLGP